MLILTLPCEARSLDPGRTISTVLNHPVLSFRSVFEWQDDMLSSKMSVGCTNSEYDTVLIKFCSWPSRNMIRRFPRKEEESIMC